MKLFPVYLLIIILLGIIPDPPADESIPPQRPVPIVVGTITPGYPYRYYIPVYYANSTN
jgi:hypothetical protein